MTDITSILLAQDRDVRHALLISKLLQMVYPISYELQHVGNNSDEIIRRLSLLQDWLDDVRSDIIAECIDHVTLTMKEKGITATLP